MPVDKERLKFPSGRPVAAARKDAKRLSRELKIPLHEALNLVASENGINKPWAEAIGSLEPQTEGHRPPSLDPSNVHIFDYETLQGVQKAMRRIAKEKNKPLEMALIDACAEGGFANPEQIARYFYVPTDIKEVMRLIVGPIMLSLVLGSEDGAAKLFLQGGPLPTALCKTRAQSSHGQVEWSKVNTVWCLKEGAHFENGAETKPGWWICNLGPEEPRIDLTAIDDNLAWYIETFFGVGFTGSPVDSKAFEYVRKWAMAYTEIATARDTWHFPDWGKLALE